MSEVINTNKEYFDKLAADYDNRFGKTIAQLQEELQKRKYFITTDWVEDDEDDEEEEDVKKTSEADKAAGDDGTTVKLLDYACGTGLVSRALAQFTTQCVGIDISEQMVGVYNHRAENQGLGSEEMRAYHGNLNNAADPDPAAFRDPLFYNFDVAGVGLGFHHFEDPEYSAKKLAERLRPGGVLFILDFYAHAPFNDPLAEDGHNHGHSHGHGHGHGHSHGHDHGGSKGTSQPKNGVMHHGFTEERLKSIFEGAGAGKDFAIAELGDGVVFHGTGDKSKRRVLLARGVKA